MNVFTAAKKFERAKFRIENLKRELVEAEDELRIAKDQLVVALPENAEFPFNIRFADFTVHIYGYVMNGMETTERRGDFLSADIIRNIVEEQ